jgi:hypothetical protein
VTHKTPSSRGLAQLVLLAAAIAAFAAPHGRAQPPTSFGDQPPTPRATDRTNDPAGRSTGAIGDAGTPSRTDSSAPDRVVQDVLGLDQGEYDRRDRREHWRPRYPVDAVTLAPPPRAPSGAPMSASSGPPGDGPAGPSAPPPLLFASDGAPTAALFAFAPPDPPAVAQGVRRGGQRPPAAEQRYAQGEVVIETPVGASPKGIAELEHRFGVRELDRFDSQLTGTRLILAAVAGDVPKAVDDIGADPAVLSAQPNYLYALDAARKSEAALRPSDPLQYALAKLHLAQAHALARGDNVLVGVIDSPIDANHPELAGAIAASFDAIGVGAAAHAHGTAIASLIVAHARLEGAAPAARILAVRAFAAVAGAPAKGTSFRILKGLDWAAGAGARVVNMSFAGPPDPDLHRALDAAYRRGLVLVAAAGNAGPLSPPLYPAADPLTIAVTATDSADALFAAANQGRYIGLAAPGVDVLTAAPGGAYQIESGTSLSAAEISGVAALILQTRPDLSPRAVRALLLATGRRLSSGAAQVELADAYAAVKAATKRPLRRQ